MGVHISRARSLEQALEEDAAPATAPISAEDNDFDTALNKLLRLLRAHSDKRAAVAAAMKAALTVPPKVKSSSNDRCTALPVLQSLHLPLPSKCIVLTNCMSPVH